MTADPHEQLIVPGSAYSAGGRNDGRPASLRLPWHYPVEAVCRNPACGQVVRRDAPEPGKLDWVHTGRMPGDPR